LLDVSPAKKATENKVTLLCLLSDGETLDCGLWATKIHLRK